ncbi:diketogulonate reductase-like aldo/keto reductase [Rhodoligotrophos appendicifer]|uniref:aldo/keto reductase n=1 Tax=Rhodoligotrophos appendicifer TaxID=987056 RepID=UPI001185C91F|nr:aldo/keto reductase [Rhodoligotrophos appendicifer]
MQRKGFGPLGVAVARIGQGTWYMDQADRATAIRALRRGIDLGMTHIDTAELYGSGAAETVVGEAISGRRDEVFLVSKVIPTNASRRGTIMACEASLRRLGTDHLDCYLLHWPGHHRIEDTVAAFHELHTQGKIRSWGVSNFDVGDLETLIGVTGPEGPACNQVLYHLQERDIEHAVLPWCSAHGVSVVGYSPFGHNGLMSRHQGWKVLEEVATDHGVTARQVVLAFLTRDREVFAIPKAASLLHVEENSGAGDLTLTPEELARIDKAFPLAARRASLPMI